MPLSAEIPAPVRIVIPPFLWAIFRKTLRTAFFMHHLLKEVVAVTPELVFQPAIKCTAQRRAELSPEKQLFQGNFIGCGQGRWPQGRQCGCTRSVTAGPHIW
jgi:hypothetical protein